MNEATLMKAAVLYIEWKSGRLLLYSGNSVMEWIERKLRENGVLKE